MEEGGSVTLIFRQIDSNWRKEHILNLIAAFATSSNFSHCELAIGEEPGDHGQMCNVLRIYNDDVGAELCQRTGRNPQYQYIQLGCSKIAEQRVLNFARHAVGRPFSMSAMARSVVWPRRTNHQTYFCAELVAAALQAGGLMDKSVNPGAATPESLYRTFAACGTTTGNPCVLRSMKSADVRELATFSNARAEQGSVDERRPLLGRLRSIGSLLGINRGKRQQVAVRSDAQRPGSSSSQRHSKVERCNTSAPSMPAQCHPNALEMGLARPPSRGGGGSISEQRIREAVRNMGNLNADTMRPMVGNMYTNVNIQARIGGL